MLGALEALAPHFPAHATAAGSALTARVQARSEEGLRVLVFAFNPDIETVHDDSGQPCLPALVPLAVVALADELRAEARETIAEFARLGIQIKIIFGG